MKSLMGLNPFKKGKKTEVEGVRKVDVSGSPLEKALLIHNKLKIPEGQRPFDFISNIDLPFVLNPWEVAQFMVYVDKHDLLKSDHFCSSGLSGHFITKLIQDSINQGYDQFILNSYKTPLDRLGYGLRANKKVPYIKVHGSVGVHFGAKANNIHFRVYGDADHWMGELAECSYFLIKGNVGRQSAEEANSCFHRITGNTEDLFGHRSVDCLSIFGGNVGENSAWDSYLCKYITFGEIDNTLGSGSTKTSIYMKNAPKNDFSPFSSIKLFALRHYLEINDSLIDDISRSWKFRRHSPDEKEKLEEYLKIAASPYDKKW